MPRKLTHEQYVKKLNEKNPLISVIDTYINGRTPIKHLCKIHNYEWFISPENELSGRGCK